MQKRAFNVFLKFDMKYILFSTIKGIFFYKTLKIDNNLNNIYLDILLMNHIGFKDFETFMNFYRNMTFFV